MKISSETQLRALYGAPHPRAAMKVLSELDKHAVNFLSKSPFLVLCTTNARGQMDASPKGGEPGFVKVLSAQEICIPDFKGNNRIDGLINLTEVDRIGLLFFIPGIDETLRINGSAEITTDAEMIAMMTVDGKAPITCIVVKVEEVFLHCAKAFMRSKLWDASAQIDPDSFPTMGQMLKDQLKDVEEAESREAMRQRYAKDL
jgi:hypothetical protein